MKTNDTMTVVTPNAEVKTTYTVQAYGFSAAGTYTITVYTASVDAGGATYTTQKYASFTVTVTAASTAATSINTYTATTGNAATAAYYKGVYSSSTDSATPVAAEAAPTTTYNAVGVVFANLYTAAGETATGTAKTTICSSGCNVTVYASGPGLIAAGVYAATNTASNAKKSATMVIHNSAGAGSSGLQGTDETLTVYTDGTATAGTVTLTYYLASNGVLLGTSTVKIAGAPASVSQMYSNDTFVALSTGSVTLNAIVKDAGSNTLKSGQVYVYSSDTKVAGSTSASAAYQSCTIGSTGVAACTVTVSDTGTANLTIRDSITVAASTWVSAEWKVTVVGTVAKAVTVAFDKSNYAPGDRAVITITATDARGVGLYGATNALFTSLTATPALTYVTDNTIRGTSSAISDAQDETFTAYMATGVETRVVTMPTYGTAVTYVVKYNQFGAAASAAPVTVTASATVTDPTKDAADAATDAALEATDAAYAAQDAAQLAAESADAATAAAEAATAAAEAATAAVEDLATKVAGLFADLQKQITTLANVVAKIAKKVKA